MKQGSKNSAQFVSRKAARKAERDGKKERKAVHHQQQGQKKVSSSPTGNDDPSKSSGPLMKALLAKKAQQAQASLQNKDRDRHGSSKPQVSSSAKSVPSQSNRPIKGDARVSMEKDVKKQKETSSKLSTKQVEPAVSETKMAKTSALEKLARKSAKPSSTPSSSSSSSSTSSSSSMPSSKFAAIDPLIDVEERRIRALEKKLGWGGGDKKKRVKKLGKVSASCSQGMRCDLIGTFLGSTSPSMTPCIRLPLFVRYLLVSPHSFFYSHPIYLTLLF